MPDFYQQIAVLQRTIMENTKNYNARAQPLFCLLNILLWTFPLPLWVSKLQDHGASMFFTCKDLVVNEINWSFEQEVYTRFIFFH